MKELIERLKVEAQFEPNEYGNILIKFADLKEAIAALESMPQWVKCSERLPEFDPPKTVLYAHHQGCIDTMRSDMIHFIDPGFITAWLEILAPPKVEQEGK